MKQMIEPVYIDLHGTKRFHDNKIIRDMIDYLRDNGNYILNSLHYLNDGSEQTIDDYRHFNQLMGYSVCGFADLSIAHCNGNYDKGYDGYISYIDNMAETSIESLKHPICPIVIYETVKLENGNLNKMKFVGNKMVKHLFETTKRNIEFYTSDKVRFTIDDKRQFLQLLGLTFEEYFEYEFNKIEFVCSGEVGIDFEHNADLVSSFYLQEEHVCYGGKYDADQLIGKTVQVHEYESIDGDQAPKAAYGHIGKIIAVDYDLENLELLYTIKFSEKFSYFKNAKGWDEFEFRRGEFHEIEEYDNC